MENTTMIDIYNFIDSNLLDEYHNNNLKKLELEKQEKEIFKKAEELNKENRIEIIRLEEENKNIERIISNAMLLLDKKHLILDWNDLELEITKKVRAKSYKKDDLISYIKENKLPVDISTEYRYKSEQLITYLNSKEYLEGIHGVTKEIESYIDISENIKLSIKKIE